MIADITQVWSDIMTLLTGSINTTQTVFYGTDGLTFLGTLAVIGVALGISLLVINVIKDFVKLRG